MSQESVAKKDMVELLELADYQARHLGVTMFKGTHVLQIIKKYKELLK